MPETQAEYSCHIALSAFSLISIMEDKSNLPHLKFDLQMSPMFLEKNKYLYTNYNIIIFLILCIIRGNNISHNKTTSTGCSRRHLDEGHLGAQVQPILLPSLSHPAGGCIPLEERMPFLYSQVPYMLRTSQFYTMLSLLTEDHEC